MVIKKLGVQQFRCFQQAFFEFSPDVTLITGNNAQGKTSVVEALSVLGRARSFRAPQLNSAIKETTDFFLSKLGLIRH
jgi:DNA replication and repair protein RecF